MPRPLPSLHAYFGGKQLKILLNFRPDATVYKGFALSLERPRVVFLGSPVFVLPVLQGLVDLHKKGELELVGVVSQPAKRGKRGKTKHDPAVAAAAKQLLTELPDLVVLQPEKAKSPDFLDAFKSLLPDVAITAAYGQILSDTFLAIPARATINVHPSLLPAYRGATPVQSALLDGVSVSGVSILFTVKELDAGNLITQKKVDIDGCKGAAHWMGALFEVGAKMLPDSLKKLRDPAFEGVDQDENPLNVEASHCFKIRKSQGKVDWHRPADEITNLERGLGIWPGCFCFISASLLQSQQQEQQVIKVAKVAVRGMTKLTAAPDDIDPSDMRPGDAAYSKKLSKSVVKCGEGILSIEWFKVAGSKEVSARDFFNRFSQPRISFLPSQVPVVVGVSGTGRSLRNLLALESESLWSIKGVFSNKDSCKAIGFARRSGLPTWTGDVAGESESLQKFILEQTHRHFGVVCLAGFLQKFPPLDLAGAMAINIHPSLLPEFGGQGMYGMHVHQAVFDSKQEQSGATVHFVSDQYDEGKIIDQIKVDISQCSSAADIAGAVFVAEKKLLRQVLDGLAWRESMEINS